MIRSLSLANPAGGVARTAPPSRILAWIPTGERVNVITHAIAAVLCIAAASGLVRSAWHEGDTLRTAGLAVYGVTLTAAYAASVLFHGSRGAARPVFRQYDRAAIYLAIAGSYTPIAWCALPSVPGLLLFLWVWGAATVGVRRELQPAKGKPRSTLLLYAVMAWTCLLVRNPLSDSLSPPGFAWLVGGCAVYSLGALSLSFQSVRRRHEIWHALAMGGSVCQFVALCCYLP
jgi:hemolysin III